MKLIVGLGNPGEKYENTRHNVGFKILERLDDEREGAWKREGRIDALIAKGAIADEDVILAMPQTFMNLSGKAVRELISWYKISPKDLIIIHDELDLPFGRIQVKKNGSSAGHRGVESIMESLKTDDFIRIRVGIGKPGGDLPTERYVLEEFGDEEKKELDQVYEEAIKKINLVVQYGYDEFVSKYNAAS